VEKCCTISPRFQGEKERKNDAFFSFFFVWSDHEARKKARKRRRWGERFFVGFGRE
jgi:hypothetical protein